MSVHPDRAEETQPLVTVLYSGPHGQIPIAFTPALAMHYEDVRPPKHYLYGLF